MQAAIIRHYGPPSCFEAVELETPVPGPGEVLVRVKASSVNPIDWKIRQGFNRAFMRYDLPQVLGFDLAGIVEQVGDAVTAFAPGDEVFGCVHHKRVGCYAEYALADPSSLALKPTTASFVEAATLPLAGLTAWQSLVGVGQLKKGQRVFIQAGSGGVGSLAIQIARSHGAHVTTTCSTRNLELVTELGADVAIDYTKVAFEDVVKDQDLVLDALGGNARWGSLACLRRGGRYVSIVSDIPAHVQRFGAFLGPVAAISKMVHFATMARVRRAVTTHFVVQRPSSEELTILANMVDAGTLSPVVERSFSLSEIAAAHKHSETGRTRGKLAIAIA